MVFNHVAELFSRYRAQLARYLGRQVASPDVAADLAQEAYLRLLQAELRDDARETRAYLFKIAENLAIDHLRKERRMALTPLSDDAWAALPDPAPSPEVVAASRERLRLLQAAIDELSPRSREVFTLARIEGLTYVQVGERLGVSPKTAFSHMVTAMTRLTKKMREE